MKSVGILEMILVRMFGTKDILIPDVYYWRGKTYYPESLLGP